MGLWAAYVLVPTAEAPADTASWAAATGTVEGWSVFACRSADPAKPEAPWSAVRGPVLTAVVLDGDAAMLIGWHDGQERFRWLFKEEFGPAYGLPGRTVEPDEATQAAQRRPVVAAMLSWAEAAGLAGADGGRLDDILARGYVFAGEGLFAALAELAVLGPGAQIRQVGPVPVRPGPESPERPDDEEPPPRRYPLVMAGGDSGGLPRQAQIVYLAAAIDHTDPSWDAFVVAHELERWGRPGCILVCSLTQIAAGVLDSRVGWQLMLATEPPIDLFYSYAAIGTEDGLPAVGPWHLVPPECPDPSGAARWARANVAADLEPPAPDRETLHTPEAAAWIGEPSSGVARRASRACEQRLGCVLYTYADLAERLDELAGWLDAAHRALIDPMPSGTRRRIQMQSVRGRWSDPTGDEANWPRALGRLRAGQLHHLQAEIDQLDGAGNLSRYRRGVTIAVDLRSPSPDRPATVEISVARSLLGHVDGGIDTVRGLARTAATTIGAVTGYAHAAGQFSDVSPFELRTGASWCHQRLDVMSRGVHWGNLIGPGHLAAIGGLGVLEQLHADGRLTRLEQWPGDRWWFETTAEPFEPRSEHIDAVAGPLASIIGRRS
ncbi:hypothetical protein [Dactylosporangium sp. NPDC049140]|uniref:hypothetical protein n=1 Tax=Dactylosporangium sp. NPDC049140 TaxID=3155647 RepID=UPI0033E503FA